ncbi:hypothetical protein LTR05_008735 [Lithohypha guttulata]|uniref:Serine/threonine-protein kinase ATG1 n=1 Tax=Lithohypha guttulata TaxID=1690604 RepID=A0AAN7PPX7_9EURO|nr:hypothetical protein LTR05_008735 [Lithohypha guttulata]
MPPFNPHALALFCLAPLNKRAEEVLAHPLNEPFVSVLENGSLALAIGHIRSKAGTSTLATLGRGNADVFVPGSSISKIQCSFELDLDTKVVMLYDRSHGQTTQVSGVHSTPFEHGRARKILVQRDLNEIIGMGGERRNLIQFIVKWHQDEVITTKKINARHDTALDYEDNPRFARTVDEAATVLPSQRATRLHTPGTQQLTMRYVKIDVLGSGQYGEVHKVIDVDSGKLMALKMLKRPVDARKQELEKWRLSLHYALKREVENLARISHPHIIEYITSQGWDGPEVELFMGLKEGTLEALIEDGDCQDVAELVFHQMLQALDCLSLNDIVHRDVKPENILYTTRPNKQFQFQLGDFGLCNRVVNAKTFAGSPLYMAPEMFQKGEQTHKVDVWSLFVTMLWTLDVGGFRHEWREYQSLSKVHEKVSLLASNEAAVSQIRDMAILNPEGRASAAQMLVKCFDGIGLSTPRDRIPALTTCPIILAVKALPAPTPVRTTRPAYQERKGLQKGRNPAVAAGRYRVEKACHTPQAQAPKTACHPPSKKNLARALTPSRIERL